MYICLNNYLNEPLWQILDQKWNDEASIHWYLTIFQCNSSEIVRWGVNISNVKGAVVTAICIRKELKDADREVSGTRRTTNNNLDVSATYM